MPRDNNKVIFTTSMDSVLKRKFNIYCHIKNVYQNQVIEDLITELLNKDKVLLMDIERLISKDGEEIGNTNK